MGALAFSSFRRMCRLVPEVHGFNFLSRTYFPTVLAKMNLTPQVPIGVRLGGGLKPNETSIVTHTLGNGVSPIFE